MIRAKTSGFYRTMSYPMFDLSGKHWDSCNKLHQVFQLFFRDCSFCLHFGKKESTVTQIG